MAVIDIQVPDIGDFDEVGVIEILVQPGQRVELEQSLITVESDKASMEIPSPAAGTLTALRIQLGDKVRKGSIIATMEVEGAAPAAAAPAAQNPAVSASLAAFSEVKTTPIQAPAAAAAAAPVASGFSGHADLDCDVLVLGGGNSAVEESIYLAGICTKLTIVTMFDLTADPKACDQLRKMPNVTVHYLGTHGRVVDRDCSTDALCRDSE